MRKYDPNELLLRVLRSESFRTSRRLCTSFTLSVMSYLEDDLGLNGHPATEEDMQMHSPVNGTVKNAVVGGGEDEDEEGEAEVVEQGKAISDDSSEEEEEDEEAARRVREGFIVDEDEDEEEEEEEDDEERRRKKRRKHKHRHRHKHRRRKLIFLSCRWRISDCSVVLYCLDGEDEEEDLDEEDLELLEENTGGRIRSRHLTRLRRGRDSEESDEGPSTRRKVIVESSDDDIDESNIIGAQAIQSIQNIWDDERAGRDDDDEMDMDDFIDDEEDEEEGAGAMAEEEREERRRERRRLEKERRKALRSRPELTGIDAGFVVSWFSCSAQTNKTRMSSAWDEIHDVFGDGHDYDWALADDDEDALMDEAVKSEMKYQDVSIYAYHLS